jgi:hypothetical protein
MNPFLKALVETLEKTAAKQRMQHAKKHFIPKDPFKTIQRKMNRKPRQYYA